VASRQPSARYNRIDGCRFGRAAGLAATRDEPTNGPVFGPGLPFVPRLSYHATLLVLCPIILNFLSSFNCSAMVSIVELPNDIHLILFLLLDVRDILALKQVCASIDTPNPASLAG
jgi:hypothetical protein